MKDEVQPIVLLVESDILVRQPLAGYLRECGFKVLEAGTADEARQHLSEPSNAVSVALVDADLPDGGFAFAKWARSVHPSVQVILAGSAEAATKEAGDLCHEGPAMAKPYEHRLVLERIRRLLAQRERAAE